MNPLTVLREALEAQREPGWVGNESLDATSAALSAVEQLAEAAKDISAYAVASHEVPYVLVRLDELAALDAALAPFSADPEHTDG